MLLRKIKLRLEIAVYEKHAPWLAHCPGDRHLSAVLGSSFLCRRTAESSPEQERDETPVPNRKDSY
jgi:hypothetical protein